MRIAYHRWRHALAAGLLLAGCTSTRNAKPSRTPAVSVPSGFHLHEGLPAGFKVDGKLAEWKLSPSVLLGASTQVAGESKVTSPDDLSATLWLALGTEGLAVAGEVRDDHVQLATELEQRDGDHVELWLALPRPKMPPMATADQFGEHEITAWTCAEELASCEDCLAWREAQAEHREALMAAFTVQYGLLSGSVVRYGPKDTAGSIHFERIDGGYRFEALIPTSALPRTSEAPLRNLKLRVDLIDNDEGQDELETRLSSASHAVMLATPLRFGAWPELLERALKENEGDSYQPGPAVRTLQAWVNVPHHTGVCPSVPEDMSPEVLDIDLSQVKPVGRFGDVELLSLPEQGWLVSRRGQAVLDTQVTSNRVWRRVEAALELGEDIGDDEFRIAPRAPGLSILRTKRDIASPPLGTGACGVCPSLEMSLVKMDARGRFSQPEELKRTFTYGESIAWEASPDLSRIEVFVDYDKAPHKLVLRYTLDPQTGGYTKESFERPSEE
ncbi:hypothetical protein NR798_39690 [Archangium gephyra]|uniref:hypothetical protein n=1 Tax=Archangium gephyra TaxID=48 RepID=UPI0035D43027